ncbi:hypothetical protein CXF85_08365 [Colwellia sp. 75C3]|uniref:hypothetical protein n=1 Tax=Colwellia sp. 75C3 TaxID=888425 RepID=UPI000C33CC8B|nr:hypothetical protein [Colwellia sp. 75C3]PKG84469.1 hypothetical protein CXF85_08365 [Colwellia sp. 75C3]
MSEKKVDVKSWRELSESDKGEVYTLVKESFHNHFTGLLPIEVFIEYMDSVSVHDKSKVFTLSLKGGIVGFASLGQEVSLFSVFNIKKNNLLSKLKIVRDLLGNKRLAFESLINILNKEKKNKGTSPNNKKGEDIYLSYICICKKNVGLGYGGLLLQSIKEYTQMQSIRAYCHLDATNDNVSGFYTNNGWSLEGCGTRVVGVLNYELKK